MPLVNEGQGQETIHDTFKSIGFWMVVQGSEPSQPVRVLVSYEALADLDPTNIRDLAAAFEHFDKYRDQIENAASKKYDQGKIAAKKYENMPLILLWSHDPSELRQAR